MRKNILKVFSLFFFSLNVFAFDWPQHETASDSFFSYFGQLRGSTISSSLVFRDSSDVKASDSGEVAIYIREHSDDFGWFESTLGSALVLSHADSIMTVYGNLDEGTVSSLILESDHVDTGMFIGESGNSAWQNGENSLEFQVFDVKNSTSINPRVLMPRVGKELSLNVGDLTLRGKNGADHRLVWEKYFPSGTYSLYRERQEVAVPYRTVVAINGATVESISYDTLSEKNGRLCAGGNDYYPVEVLYPDSKKQLLANILLTRGHNTLSVTVTDILGASHTLTYNIDVN